MTTLNEKYKKGSCETCGADGAYYSKLLNKKVCYVCFLAAMAVIMGGVAVLALIYSF